MRFHLPPFSIYLLVFLVASPLYSSSADQEISNTLVITDANVVTMEPNDAVFSTIIVEEGYIIDVGDTSIQDNFDEKEVDRLELGGKTILPGFIDSHAHWIGDQDYEQYNVDEIMDLASSYGWTSLSEQFVNQQRLDELIELDTTGRLKLRVNAWLPINYETQRFGTWYQAYQPHQLMSERVRIAGVKLFMDNGPSLIHNDRSIWFEANELNPIIQEVHDLGYQLSIHSIIDTGTDLALDAIEAAGVSADERPRIEHAQVLRDEQLDRLLDMDITTSVQMLWHSAKDRTWFENAVENDTVLQYSQIARWRDVLDKGIHFIAGTDTPWGVPEDLLGSSILGLYMMTTRKASEEDDVPQWMADQRVSIEEILRAITIDAAWGTFEEDVKGSIKNGKYADFVVLSDNPLEMDPDDLLDLSVVMTIIGGEIVYCNENYSELCKLEVIDRDYETSAVNILIYRFSSFQILLVLLIRYKEKLHIHKN